MWGTDTVWQKDVNGVFLANNDHLYTTDVLTGALNGNNSWGALRESFGKTTVRLNAGTDYLMRFPGQYFNFESNLFYNYFLEYEFITGRYVSTDPSELRPRETIYGYVNQNPIKLVDPKGLFTPFNHRGFSVMAFDATNFMERCGDERVRNNAIHWSVFYDFEEGSQASENSFTHAMRYPTQSLEIAVSKWRFFIYDRVRACNGVDLGFALHAAQDSKSEAHEGFQTWDGGGLFG